MTRKLQNILQGVGSIVNIMPAQTGEGYGRFVPKGTTTDRMGKSWRRVGQSLRRATGKYQRDRKA